MAANVDKYRSLEVALGSIVAKVQLPSVRLNSVHSRPQVQNDELPVWGLNLPFIIKIIILDVKGLS